MKRLTIITATMAIAATTWAQGGAVNFKTVGSVNPILYSTDGGPFQAMPTNLFIGPYGHVSFGILSAPNGTAPLTANQIFTYATFGISLPSGWSETTVTGTYSPAPGVVATTTGTVLPASSGAGGANVEMEIIAWTGNLGNVTLLAFSGDTSNGSSVTYNGNTYSTGEISWSQPTGSESPPAPVPADLVRGSAGLGSLVFSIPEPSSIALSGLGAAALMLFRRRK